eukprot:COSAG02_NODE_270_length_26392_cov_29.151980_11_plen_111_part_00
MQPPPPPPPYQRLPPHWQTRTDASGKLLYISPDGQTHVAPPTAVSGLSAWEADGAISADLFGGDVVPLAAQTETETERERQRQRQRGRDRDRDRDRDRETERQRDPQRHI